MKKERFFKLIIWLTLAFCVFLYFETQKIKRLSIEAMQTNVTSNYNKSLEKAIYQAGMWPAGLTLPDHILNGSDDKTK